MFYVSRNTGLIKLNKKVVFLCHTGLGDHILLNGAVNYLSMFFDVNLVTLKEYASQLQELYSNNNKVKLVCVDNPAIYLNTLVHEECFLYVSGGYRDQIGQTNSKNSYPKCFYDELDIPFEYCKKYFDISGINDILEPPDQPYIFIHEKYSAGHVDIFGNLNTDKLVIDPNKNHYEKGHKFYEIAEKYIKPKSIFKLKNVIENADELHMVESSIMCLTLFLKTKSKITCHLKRSTLLDNQSIYQ